MRPGLVAAATTFEQGRNTDLARASAFLHLSPVVRRITFASLSMPHGNFSLDGLFVDIFTDRGQSFHEACSDKE